MTLQQHADRLLMVPELIGTLGELWEKTFEGAIVRPSLPLGDITCLDGEVISVTPQSVILAFRGDSTIYCLAEAFEANAKAATFLLIEGESGPFCRPTARPWVTGDQEQFVTDCSDGIKRTVTAIWPVRLLRALARCSQSHTMILNR